MNEIYKKARAKINLNLIVLNKRKDGYHNLKSVFQKINLYDEIYVKKIPDNKFELKTNIESINNNQNIIYKAYIKLKEKYKNITGVQVVLNKKIPMQAGLGGGSTDCASFIICMNKLFHLNLSKIEIEKLGSSLGADVVPCLYDGVVLAEGIGDKVTKIDTNLKYYTIIIKPKMSCDTKEMYNKIDSQNRIDKIDTSDKIIKGLMNNDIDAIANNLYNSFERVIKDDTIEKIKNEFIKNGAIGSLMTGSGSCVFGLFKNKRMAREAYKNLKDIYEAYICISYNKKMDNSIHLINK